MLTPDQIRTYEFQKAGMSGYKAVDVDYFLEEVANDFAALCDQRDELIQKIQILADNIEEYRATEDSVKSAILNAQKTGDAILRESKQKADDYYNEKISQADRDAAEAKESTEKMVHEATVQAQELVDSATMKAKQILSQAEEKAANIEKDAEKKITKQIITYNYLKDEIEAFKNRVSENIHKQLDLLSQIPRENKNIEKRAAEQQAQDTQTAQSEQDTSLQTEPSASTVDSSEPQRPISGTQITL